MSIFRVWKLFLGTFDVDYIFEYKITVILFYCIKLFFLKLFLLVLRENTFRLTLVISVCKNSYIYRITLEKIISFQSLMDNRINSFYCYIFFRFFELCFKKLIKYLMEGKSNWSILWIRNSTITEKVNFHILDTACNSEKKL